MDSLIRSEEVIFMYKILIFLFIFPALLSQIDTTRINFYPLQIGNEWIYQSVTYEYSAMGIDTIKIDTVVTKITGDTLMPNGKIYYCIEGTDGGFRRIDTLSLKIYEFDDLDQIESTDEYVIYDLKILDSLNWIDGFGNTIEIRTSDTEEQVGYLNETAIQTKYLGAYYYNHRVLSGGFGLSYLEYGCMLLATIEILIGAKIDGIVYSNIIDIAAEKDIYSQDFKLYPIYPNPFNTSTSISYDIYRNSDISIKIFNSLGQMKQILFNKILQPGSYKVNWDASNFESGLYFINLKSGNYTETRKCVLIK